MRILVFLIVLLLECPASASEEGPIATYFPRADKIYIARIISLDQGAATFAVTNSLRGSPETSLSLGTRDLRLTSGSEWLILSCARWRSGYDGNKVGDFMEGNCGWIFAPVKRENSQVYTYSPGWKNGQMICDRKIDGLGYITLEHAEALLKEPPSTP